MKSRDTHFPSSSLKSIRSTPIIFSVHLLHGQHLLTSPSRHPSPDLLSNLPPSSHHLPLRFKTPLHRLIISIIHSSSIIHFTFPSHRPPPPLSLSDPPSLRSNRQQMAPLPSLLPPLRRRPPHRRRRRLPIPLG